MTPLVLLRPGALAAAVYPPYALFGTDDPSTVVRRFAPRLLADFAPQGSGGAHHPAML
ncbi:hypothetical protein [Candidatus Sodalis sp. SoCistrobi]|uniref:hypothetical protein n=1 Tax=Candidatus Sodalis sp. SoCistrobi TaxID=1922216 RepID=UPI0015763B0A|nr:hypothetical protein [Candidatus Sodalis sp. SoCistrobi]